MKQKLWASVKSLFVNNKEKKPVKNRLDNPWQLGFLTPLYRKQEHEKYVETLDAALENDELHNIALSGTYGVGKSSILQEVARRHNKCVIELSLSTLTQADLPSNSKSDQETTNKIQQEIVKQLLYSGKPNKASASRFHRIEGFHWLREIWRSILLAFPLSLFCIVFGWTDKLASSFIFIKSSGEWKHIIIWAVITIIIFLIKKFYYGKLYIKQLSTGYATISLEDNKVSYFDQYLDEIVYFFEIMPYEIVVFEDIDRFNNPHIFETLRALNTLLNSSPQIKNKTVRFIYAVKDSIFDDSLLNKRTKEDDLEIGSIRANRTKFFDLIIPVVPFITHQNSRELMLQTINNIKHKIDPKLIYISAKYIPDMRLIQNICNEYVIFHDRLVPPNNKGLDLKNSILFAMMIYKSIYIVDFEKIRQGRSKLDYLYKKSREIIAEGIRDIEAKNHALIYEKRLPEISEEIGNKLITYIDNILRSAGYEESAKKIWFHDQEISLSEIRDYDFWHDMASENLDAQIKVEVTSASNSQLSAPIGPIYNRVPRYNHTFIFTKGMIQEFLDSSWDVERWKNNGTRDVEEALLENDSIIKILRSADFQDLLINEKINTIVDTNQNSFDDIMKEMFGDDYLAHELIREGYVDSNFTLYTSIFHGGIVSSSAMNFIIHHIERNIIDVYFELTPKDVKTILDQQVDVTRDPIVYNISIMDYLVSKNDKKLNTMIEVFGIYGEVQKNFLQAYLTGGKYANKFIKIVINEFAEILICIISDLDLSDSTKLELVNLVLGNMTDGNVLTDYNVQKYILDNYSRLTVFQNRDLDDKQADNLAALCQLIGLRVPSLINLSMPLFRPFVIRNLYEITIENICEAIGIEQLFMPSLDIVKKKDNHVYKYLISTLSIYQYDIGNSNSIISSEYFVDILDDIRTSGDHDLLDTIVEKSSDECIVSDISDVSVEIWRLLARHSKFLPTLDNIYKYISKIGDIDASLAPLLSSNGKIEEVSNDESKKITIAVHILTSSELKSPYLKVELVKSLALEHYIDVSEIDPHPDEFFAVLLKENIISDTAESYERLEEMDWKARKLFIIASNAFESYMTPQLISKDLQLLLTSEDIPISVKNIVLENALLYLDESDFDGAEELANFALGHDKGVSVDVIFEMAQRGIKNDLVIRLLVLQLDRASFEEISDILKSLDGDYPSLIEVGGRKLKFHKTKANTALLKYLLKGDVVTSVNEKQDVLEVHRRRK